jgi:hypothetical protein
MQQLRIEDESKSVARKALKNTPPVILQYLPLSLDLSARDAFFACYVPDTSKYWHFLKTYYLPADSPPHLKLAIEAVSLAYLWHQVYSDVALATARQKYVSALRTTSKLLRSPTEATKDTTLMMVLMLDIFEKIMGCQRQNGSSWKCHVNGALALVNLRGLENFQEYSSMRILLRLGTDHVGDCITSFSPVLGEWVAVSAYAAKQLGLDAQDINWRLSQMMVGFANLRSEIWTGTLPNDECIAKSLAFDLKLQALEADTPSSWQYSSTLLDQKSERTFNLHFDSYPSRSARYGRNILRIVRMLVNESLLDLYRALPTRHENAEALETAHNNIKILVDEICASVPQFADCDGAARRRLPISERSNGSPLRKDHYHTPAHQLDCYTLIFPLYVAGRSDAVPGMRSWVIKQLHYISSHFHIRMAQVVAQTLEGGAEVDPWEVNNMLGSYAFAA